MSNHATFFGFPPPLLGANPQRLPVLFDQGDWLLLEKPVDVLVLQDNWYPRTPVLTEAIRFQARQGKAELVSAKVGEHGLFGAYALDPYISGPILYARDSTVAEDFRNKFGSFLGSFTFELLVRERTAEESLHCDLPIARHTDEARMIVSHRTGKKSETQFSKLKTYGHWALWEAKTTFVRPDQILLHSFESGLSVIGDNRYAEEPELYVSRLIRHYRPSSNKEERPLYDGPALRLVGVDIPGHGYVRVDDNKPWRSLKQRMERYS